MSAMEPHHPPALSAAVVVGMQRGRSQRALDALCAQTAVDAMEIVVVDIAPPEVARLPTPPHVRVTYISRPTANLFAARHELLRHVTSPVVAFVEEHCVAAPNWAEVLIETHKGPWAAVGYAFANANPQRYVSRAGLVNDYGLWMAPARRGESRFLPEQNLSYKTAALAPFGDAIERLMAPDFVLHEELRARGARMFVEANAVVAHENFNDFHGPWRAHFNYMRLLSARRADRQGWSHGRRMAYGVAVLGAAPVIGMWRRYRALVGRRELVPAFLAALPVCIVMALFAGVGESVGYLFGEGDAERAIHHWELVAERNGP